MDNTNDPVGVLICALEKLAAQDSGIVASSAKSDCMAATAKAALRNYKAAANPHSEQRETVAAGECIGYVEPNDVAYLTQAMAEGRKTSITLRSFSSDPMNATVPLYLGTPIAAPVPEAKAEQVTDANDICQLPPEGWYCTRKAGHDGPCAAHEQQTDRELDADDHACVAAGMQRIKAHSAAPAVKHEASELQHLENCIGGDKGPCNCELVRQMHSPLSPPDSVERVIDAIKAAPVRIAARADMTPKGNMSVEFPPIAVQGSIGDDDGFLSVLSDYAKTLTTCGVSDIQWSMDRLIAYIDSRSPVAAAPETSARDALEEVIDLLDEIGAKLQADDKSHDFWMGVGAMVQAGENAIRALSAAAPSADAKDSGHD